MSSLAPPAFAPLDGARSIEAHVVQSGAWFYVVGRDGGYVRAADGDEDSRLVCYSLREDAQTHADGLNAVCPGESQIWSGEVQDPWPVVREREMMPYDKGYRDGDDRRPKAPPADTDDADLEADAEGYGDGCQLRDDEHLEQMMNVSPDGARAIGGYWLV